MQVATIMTRDVKSCVPADSLDRPAHLMLAHDTGCVAVVDAEGRALGLITDRDLCMAAFVSGRALHDLSVERTITGRLHACREDDAVETAHAIMSEHAVRRLPVVDADGKLVGMLSLADLVQVTPYVSSKTARNKALEHLLGTLQAVTSPRDTDLAERFAAVSAKPKRKRAASSKTKSTTARRKTTKKTAKTAKTAPARKAAKPKTAAKSKKTTKARKSTGKTARKASSRTSSARSAGR